MESGSFLSTTVVFLAAAVLFVPLFRRFGLASVLGYLAAGSILGPWGLGWATDYKSIMHFAEMGVVMLLFLIGLELKPSRLWVMRQSVFGYGGAQVLLSTLAIFPLAYLQTRIISTSLLMSVCLSLSSTAFALQILAEKNQLNTQHGRHTFSILLFQDLLAIPLLALIPVLSAKELAASGRPGWQSALIVAVSLIATILIGRYLLRPAFRIIAQARSKEIFTAATLLLVLGMALYMNQLGLSMALGSFLAGVLLAESEYRHELEADIDPFKGLLLGLFFMAIGMSVDYGLLLAKPFSIFGWLVGLLTAKFLVVWWIGRKLGLSDISSRNMAAVLPQGGEFAFVLFGLALTEEVLSAPVHDLMVVVVTLSMAMTPFIVWANDKWLRRILQSAPEPEYDTIPEEDSTVIIAGFGRVGQIVGRILRTLDVPFTALEIDADQVDVLRKFGNKVYYGDASRLDLLEAAGAKKAKYFIVCIETVDASLRVVDMVQSHFSNLQIIARARNRGHAYSLLDRGIKSFHRETFASSLELTESLLVEMGYPKARAHATIEKFRKYDEEMLINQHSIHKDEKQLIQFSREAAQQLTDLMKEDEKIPASTPL